MLSDGNLVVGEMFSEREKWIPDSFELRYSNGTFFLQLNFENPTKREVDCFNSGAIHLGLYVENGITFFLMHIAGIMDWSDQAFSIRLLDESEQNLPEAGVYYTPIHFILVNASNGKVASMRTVTMSPPFVNLFRSELTKQKQVPFSKEKYFSEVKKITNKFPNSKDMARCAAIQERAGKTL